MEINLTKPYIYQYVTTVTSAIGRSTDKFDQVACLPDNYPVLDRYMDAAVSEVEAKLHLHLTGSLDSTLAYNGSDLMLHLSDHNGTLSQSSRGLLATQLRFAVAYTLVYMWLCGVNFELADHYAKMADGYIDAASGIFAGRDVTRLTEADYHAAATDDVSLSPAATGPDGCQDAARDDVSLSPAATGPDGCQDAARDDVSLSPAATGPDGCQDAARDDVSLSPAATGPDGCQDAARDDVSLSPAATGPDGCQDAIRDNIDLGAGTGGNADYQERSDMDDDLVVRPGCRHYITRDGYAISPHW